MALRTQRNEFWPGSAHGNLARPEGFDVGPARPGDLKAGPARPGKVWPGPLVNFCHLLQANSYNLIFERITIQNFSVPAAGCLYYPLKVSVSVGSYLYYPLKIFRRLRRATFITPSKLFDACDGLLISSLKNFWRLRWATYITIQKFLAPAAGYL